MRRQRSGQRQSWAACATLTGYGGTAGHGGCARATRGLTLCPPQARLWVQLMRELRHGVKLKKVQEKQFNPLPTEYQLTPFEMLMQDIRARNYKLRKVMVSVAGLPPYQRPHGAGLPAGLGTARGPSALSQVDGDIPPRVKKDAHELILDFIRSRPPLKQVGASIGTPPWRCSAGQGSAGPMGATPAWLGT